MVSVATKSGASAAQLYSGDTGAMKTSLSTVMSSTTDLVSQLSGLNYVVDSKKRSRIQQDVTKEKYEHNFAYVAQDWNQYGQTTTKQSISQTKREEYEYSESLKGSMERQLDSGVTFSA